MMLDCNNNRYIKIQTLALYFVLSFFFAVLRITGTLL